jgi:AGCS family alanine or glycine:cation symporter
MKRVKVQRHIAAAANVSHPTKQGLVQSLFGVYRYVVSLLSNRVYVTLLVSTCTNPNFGTDGASEFI